MALFKEIINKMETEEKQMITQMSKKLSINIKIFFVIRFYLCFLSNSSIQVNPRCHKCGVTSYYIKRWEFS